MKLHRRWFGLVGVLALLTLVLAACGGAVSTPKAAMDDGQPAAASQANADETTMNAADDSMMKDETDKAMMDDSGEAMQDGADEAMMDDSGDTMQDGSDEALMDDSGETMTGSSDEAMMDDSGEAMMDDSGEAMQDSPGQAMMDLPGWFNAELTDVSSGETFRLADLQGQVVLVETMAIWCSNCLRQQQEVKALHEALGPTDGFVTVVLDVDPNERAGDLKAYTARNGFDWTYAVAPREVAREIGQLYGDQFLNPPSTPMLIVDRHGGVHPLPFGIKRVGDLEAALEPFLDDGL
jgi:hypothetical protein